MSWVLSLARSGGTAGSQGGHETRRHRVRGPFPMGACLLLAGSLALAGCGSSSNSTVTINGQQPQPEPELEQEPQIGDGDGGQTVTQPQQQQPQPEPEPEPQTGGGSGEGEGDGGQGAGGGTPPTDTTTTEDGDGDTGSGDTTTTGGGGTGGGGTGGGGTGGGGTGGGGTGGGGTGGGGNPPPNNPVVSRSVTPSRSTEFTGFPTVGGSSILDSITATYTRQYGFQGEYVYKGASGQFSSDVKLIFTLDETSARIRGYLGDDIVMQDDGWYGLLVDATVDTETGSFTVTDPEFGFYAYGNLDDSPSRVNRTDSGTGTIKAKFSNGGSNDDLPSIIKGEVNVTGFRRKVAGSADNYESAETGGKINSLTGRFSSDFVSDIKLGKLAEDINSEGNIGMFDYGLWASVRPEENRFSFPIPENTHFYPLGDIRKIDVGGGFHNIETDAVEVTYKKENGFHGAYVYKDRIGTFRSDVDLVVKFNTSETLAKTNRPNDGASLTGFIAKPFTMGGDRFDGIVVRRLDVRRENGSLEYFTGTTELQFGSVDSSGSLTKQQLNAAGDFNVNDMKVGFTEGVAGSLSISADGLTGKGGGLDSEGNPILGNYPNHILGGLKITGFSLDETENYSDNSLVGVFVGDKGSAKKQ